jgi:hypothetical protein
MTRLESLLEGLFEQSFARLFRARLQPVEIAKRLSREMEAGRVVGVSSVLVPNYYEVSLSPSDYATLAPIRASLEDDMARYLARFAREHNYSTTADPEVHVFADPALRPRHVTAVGRLTESPRAGVPVPPPTERLDPTRMMPRLDAAVAPPPVEAPGPAALTLDETAYPLAGDSVSLGRGLENDIVLEDRRVSRIHARLVNTGGYWTVRDEGSTNGIFVNGRMVAQHVLKNGDRLSLGGLELTFGQR